jgi:class 3 adenylate cyclase
MIKYYFLCLVGLFGTLQSLAQLNLEKIDSLKQELVVKPDSQKLEILIQLAKEYRRSNRSDSLNRGKGLDYARQARSLARRINDKEGLNEAFDNLLWYYNRTKMRDSADFLDRIRGQMEIEEGYLIPKDFKQGNSSRRRRLQRRTGIFYDSTGNMAFDSTLRNQNFGLFDPNLEDIQTLPGSWWLRIRIRSEAENWEEHIFFAGGDQERWDSVQVFVPDAQGEYTEILTGYGLDKQDWNIPGRANHFRINVPPQSDQVYYFRLKGPNNALASSLLRINHINYEAFLRNRVRERHANGIFQGIVLIQLFFFLLLFLATRDRIYGYYSIYIMGLCLFIITVNYLSELEFVNTLEQQILKVVSIWVAMVGMLTFTYNYLNLDTYIRRARGTLKVYLITFSIITLSLNLVFPFIITSSGVNPNPFVLFMVGMLAILFVIMCIIGLVLLLVWGISVYRKGYSPAKFYLIATSFLILGFVLPMVMSPLSDYFEAAGLGFLAYGPTLISGSIALQLCLFALAVGHKRNLLEKERREALQSNLEIQQKINAATDRFVPYEFLKKLGRESILDVNLGDQVEKNVTVFFSDIRDYTSLSEQMTPQQNFIFLNAYLGRVGPIIKTNRGFVSQYYGDGIMALFMGDETGIKSPQDSVIAALEMHQEIRHYNQDRLEKGRKPIRVGIGMHSGPLMLGIIGDEKRMDVGVVSDTVNTAARMEGLTKHYGCTTLLSESTFDGLSDTNGFNFRFLGRVQVKGKKNPLRIYDFFDGDANSIAEQKNLTLDLFRMGLEHYFEKDFQEAVRIFQEILKQFPEDKASQFYLQRSQQYLLQGIPEGWTGIESISKK